MTAACTIGALVGGVLLLVLPGRHPGSFLAQGETEQFGGSQGARHLNSHRNPGRAHVDQPLEQRLQDTLGPGYEVQQELGGGGMSRVFAAQDLSLGRRVVVKVVLPELSSGLNGERFRREILRKLDQTDTRQSPAALEFHRCEWMRPLAS